MPLFSKHHPAEESHQSNRATTTWSTNAPGNWPKVERTTVAPNAPEAMRQLSFIASLQKALRTSHSACRIAGLVTTRLDAKGLLDITLELEDQGTRVPVLLYPAADEASAAHYAGAVRFLEARGDPKPVYFAPAELPAAEPVDPLRGFGSGDLALLKESPPKEEFAMWWSSDGDALANRSPCVAAIGRAYRALDGIETYVFGAMMRQLRQVGPETGRVRLPKEGATLYVEGPEGRQLLLEASQEKGIRFMFPVKRTPVAYRDAFWTVFADYAETWKKGATERGLARDPAAEVNPLGWWTGMEKVMTAETEKGNPPERIGLSISS